MKKLKKVINSPRALTAALAAGTICALLAYLVGQEVGSKLAALVIFAILLFPLVFMCRMLADLIFRRQDGQR